MNRSYPLSASLPVFVLLALVTSATVAAAQQAATDPDGLGRRQSAADTVAPRQAERQEPGDAAASLLARGGAFTASVEMVRVPVIVVDDDGSFVQNLTRDDFAVHDGRRDHSVDHFISDAEPVIVGVLVDASVEMRALSDDVRIAVERIAHNLRPDDELFLISYGADVAMLHGPTADKESLVRAMGGYTIGDAADRALYDAIGSGLSALQVSPIEKRSLIVIGAGGDTASELGELSARQLISLAGVTIHAIAMAPQSARTMPVAAQIGRLRTLSEIAAFTAGFVARRPRLAARYGGASGWSAAAGTDLSTYLKHQYLLHYAPQDPPRPGTWRSIRVNVAGKHREIRARSGYTR